MESSFDFTLVVAVDHKHLNQLAMVWPTWRRHKPSFLLHPMLVIYDHTQVTRKQVLEVVDHPNLTTVPWPPPGVLYPAGTGKWDDAQRYKMLASFVYLPPAVVKTPYWLKLDCDVVTTNDDHWLTPIWFLDKPAIVAQGWSFTKPADQMQKLDKWVEANHLLLPELAANEPLNLLPNPGWSRLSHKRIISWCGFFRTDFSAQCARYAFATSGAGKLPVQSQDGFHFYCASRLHEGIHRVNFKSLGFEHWGTERNIRQAVERSMTLGVVGA